MNVLNRKMFQKARPRPARDALNKAGGIMSSSPELMNTVQMFSNGGGIKKAIPSLAQRNILKDQFRRQNNQIRIPGGEFEQQERLMKPSIYSSFYDTVGPDSTIRKNAEKGAEQAKQESLITGSQAVGRFPAIAPDGTRIGYPIFDNGELKGYTELKPTEDQKTRGMALGENFPTQSDAFGGPTYNFDLINSESRKNRYKDPATIRQELNITGNITGQRSGSEYQTPVIDISKDKNAQALLEYNREMADGSGIGGFEQGLPFRPGVKVRSMGPLYDDPEGMGALSEGQTGQLQNLAAENQTALLEGQSEEMNAELEAARIASEIRNQEDQTELETAREASFEDARQGMSTAEARRINEDAATTGEESSIGPDGLMTEGLGSAPTAERVASDVDKNQVSDVDLDILREEGRMQQGQISRSGENLANSVETGNKDALTSQLKDLMAQFTSNAPKYEGIDKGMAMMKIGFAMAAGKSPYAMQNIANALSSGADMFIKDKSKKDAFNRQVNLSALQYGLGEIGKDKAQSRADARSFTDFVDEDGNTVRVSAADYFNNGNKLPKGLQDKLSYTAIQKGILEREKATIIANSKLKELSRLTPTQQTDLLDDYKTNVKKASEAETAGTLLETVMMNADNIVGAGPALRQTGADFLAVFGIDAPKGWNDQALSVQDLKAALQSVVPATLGSTQSANSISNRDVELLIAAFLQEGIMTGENGNYSFLTTSREKFNNSLKNGLSAVRRSQAEALNSMSSIEQQLTYDFTTTSGRVGTELLKPLQSGRKGALFGATAAEGFTPTSLTLGKDNIWDIT